MVLDYSILILSALLTSTLSGILGMGGGITLFAVMAQYFPPLVLIPLHGTIQLASNTSRTFFVWKSIRWPIVFPFFMGAMIGATLGSQMIIEIPEKPFQIGIGVFILLLTFVPRPKSLPKIKGKWFWVGSTATFTSLFVGPTGPLLAGFFVHEDLERRALIGTKAACQVTTHLLKIITYGLLGFQFYPYAPLAALMIGAVFLGSYIGTSLLGKLPERTFRILFKSIILILSLRLIARATL